jgi:hypothetical protein
LVAQVLSSSRGLGQTPTPIKCRSIALLAASLIFCIPSARAAGLTTGHFQLTPFGGAEPQPALLAAGVTQLFAGTSSCKGAPQCLTPSQLSLQVKSAMHFRQGLVDLVSATIRGPGHGVISYNQTDRNDGFLAIRHRTDFVFPSLVQTPGAPLNNFVRGIYLRPNNFQDPRHPTVVLIHSSVDNFDNDELPLAENLASTNQMAVLAIYFPYYGPRHASARPSESDDFNDDFFDSNPLQLVRNVGQGLMDLHMALDWLRQTQSPWVNPARISMLGLSWGAMLQTLFEGINPGETYKQALFVGGGDLASVMAHYSVIDPDNQTVRRLRAAGWEESKFRAAVSPIDPLVWAHRVHVEKILTLNATKDELMDRNMNLGKLLIGLRSGSPVAVKWIEGQHAPRDKGIIDLFVHLFLPLQNFFIDPPGPYAY